MGKVHVEAILDALKQTVESLTVDGICNRNKIITKSVDEQYVQDLENGYSDNIQDIIDNIPDVPPTPPGPTLPTIWQSRANVSPSNQTIAVGGISLLSRDGQVITYYSDHSYAFRRWVKFTTTDRSPGEIISNAGCLAVKNTGTSAVTGVYNVDYASCSSNQAEVVTVYNSSNEAFNAFKYTVDGTDYYYVLDEVQTDWTDDLSSIGYYLPIVGYANQQKKQTFVNNNSSTETPLFDEDGRYLTYDATKQDIIVGFWTSADGSKQSTPSGFYIYHNTSQTIYTFFYYKSGGSGTYFQRLEFILVPK